MFNLLTNAVRFTERGGVVVRARLDEGYVRVSVAIPDRRSRRGIRQDFRRVRAHFDSHHRRKRAGGFGGWPISKQLVELHGGAICVESTQGVGTTFLRYRCQALMRCRWPKSGRARGSESSKEHVVVVHPDPAWCAYWRAIWMAIGWSARARRRDIVPLRPKSSPSRDCGRARSIEHSRLLAQALRCAIVICAIPCAAEQMQIEGI
jgi:hypothetical protein